MENTAPVGDNRKPGLGVGQHRIREERDQEGGPG